MQLVPMAPGNEEPVFRTYDELTERQKAALHRLVRDVLSIDAQLTGDAEMQGAFTHHSTPALAQTSAP